MEGLVKIIPIKENIKEKDFEEWLLKRGYNGMRFNSVNLNKIKAIIKRIAVDYNESSLGMIFEEKDIPDFCIFFENLGKPDFFIWKNKEFYFCEFKTKNDSLRPDQMDWIMNHPDFPILIAKVTNPNKKKYYLNIERWGFNYKKSKIDNKELGKLLKRKLMEDLRDL